MSEQTQNDRQLATLAALQATFHQPIDDGISVSFGYGQSASPIHGTATAIGSSIDLHIDGLSIEEVQAIAEILGYQP